MADDDRLWDYKDVARFMKNSELTIEKWANERRLPVVKIGALNRFDPKRIRSLALAGKIPLPIGHRFEEDGVTITRSGGEKVVI
jgi:hypothetical protein